MSTASRLLCVAVVCLVPASISLADGAADNATKAKEAAAAPKPAPSRQAQGAEPAGVPVGDWRMLWDDGIRFSAPDNVTTFKLGGLFQYDGYVDAESGGPVLSDDHGWRMLRPNLSGRITKDIDWRAEFDFATSHVRMTDVYVRFSNVPWVKTVRVGHFKEPFALDQFTSSANVTFPEIALAAALAPQRGYGVLAGGPFADDRMTLFAGIYRDSDEAPSRYTTGGNAWAVTARLTGLPQWADDGKHYTHLGLAGSLRAPDNPVKFSSKPECALASTLTDTGNLAVDDDQLIGGEFATVQGPLHLTAEYIAAHVDPAAGGEWVSGWYVEAGYFLTGESRPYDRKSGTFGAVKPAKGLDQGGLGAWQLAARYSVLDLTGSGFGANARELSDFTLGLNWYMTKNLKLSLDWVNSDADPSAKDGGLFAARLQASF